MYDERAYDAFITFSLYEIIKFNNSVCVELTYLQDRIKYDLENMIPNFKYTKQIEEDIEDVIGRGPSKSVKYVPCLRKVTYVESEGNYYVYPLNFYNAEIAIAQYISNKCSEYQFPSSFTLQKYVNEEELIDLRSQGLNYYEVSSIGTFNTGIVLDCNLAWDMLFKQCNINFPDDGSDDDQRLAIISAFTHSVVCINGHAGTGKTFVCGAIIKILNVIGINSENILCCAPTGKAAKELKRRSKFNARTMHACMNNPPRRTHVVIIDEASMVDLLLLSRFLAIINPDVLIMVGDDNQLEPVSAGAPYIDVIASADFYDQKLNEGLNNNKSKRNARLTRIRRQEEGGTICKCALDILNGTYPKLANDKGDNSAFRVVHPDSQTSNTDVALKEVKKLYKRMNDKTPMGKKKPPMIIAQTNDVCWTLSKEVQEMYLGKLDFIDDNKLVMSYSQTRGKPKVEWTWRDGDMISCIENHMVGNGKYFIPNGEIGYLEISDNVNKEEEDDDDDEEEDDLFNENNNNNNEKPKKNIMVKYFDIDDIPIYESVSPDDLMKRFRPGYALTVHRAQGQGEKHVLFVLSLPFNLQKRQSLYTGATRSINTCTIIGKRGDFNAALKQFRNTGERLGFLQNTIISMFASDIHDANEPKNLKCLFKKIKREEEEEEKKTYPNVEFVKNL